MQGMDPPRSDNSGRTRPRLRHAVYTVTALVALAWLCTGAVRNEDITGTSGVLGNSRSIVLGVVEGFTELLPISSTGHLIIAQHLLGLDGAAANHGEEAPVDTFIVIIQLGAFAAILVAYWRRWVTVARGVFGGDRGGRRLAINLAIALGPVVLLGLVIEPWISRNLFSIRAVAIGAAAGAVIMFAVQRRRENTTQIPGRGLESLRLRDACLVGVMQCLALWPGMSRSMTTMAGGFIVGLSMEAAAEFSFLLGVPTLAGAALLKGIKHGNAMVMSLGWGPILLGCAVAGLMAGLSIRLLLHILNRHGLAPFAYYRLGLAVVLVTLSLG